MLFPWCRRYLTHGDIGARVFLPLLYKVIVAALHERRTPAFSQDFPLYGLVRLQEFDAATKCAIDGLNSSRLGLSSLTPYFEPWGASLAFTGKVLFGGDLKIWNAC